MPAIPVYSRKLFDGQGLGTGVITAPADPLNYQIWRDINFFAGLGGTFALRTHSTASTLWCLITPPDLFFFFDQKHLVQPPGEDWSFDLFPVGTVDVTAFGYVLSPP
jgi:hypothetical protein